jgi:hypothetical protein
MGTSSIMQRLVTHGIGCVAAASLLTVLAGCSPASDAERAYLDAREEQRLQKDSLRQTLEGVSGGEAAIDTVKQSAAPGGAGTVEQWVRQQTGQEKGDLLFPRWEAIRRSLTRYEVRHTYRVMSESGLIAKKGYAWDVDLVLKQVSGPRDLQADAITSQTSTYVPPSPRKVPREIPPLEE